MDLSNAQWRKSSYSSNGGSSCVEVARNLPGVVAVRDTKQHGAGPVLEFTPEQWHSLLQGIKAGQFPA